LIEKKTQKKKEKGRFFFLCFSLRVGGWVDVCVCSFFGSFELQ
jgi:hypothetical protein